eukprot:Tbor_TRINITY_DN3822_c0_g1::TRINITY_DN3822_c0_g1_i1::g.5697::m.5697
MDITVSNYTKRGKKRTTKGSKRNRESPNEVALFHNLPENIETGITPNNWKCHTCASVYDTKSSGKTESVYCPIIAAINGCLSVKCHMGVSSSSPACTTPLGKSIHGNFDAVGPSLADVVACGPAVTQCYGVPLHLYRQSPIYTGPPLTASDIVDSQHGTALVGAILRLEPEKCRTSSDVTDKQEQGEQRESVCCGSGNVRRVSVDGLFPEDLFQMMRVAHSCNKKLVIAVVGEGNTTPSSQTNDGNVCFFLEMSLEKDLVII